MPSRLEVAKQGIRNALDTFSHQRVGLVLYAGSASILCPLTNDYGFVRFMLEQAHPRSVDFGGTTLQAAIEKAIDQVFVTDRKTVQDLIVLTDGGDHGSQIPRVLELIESHTVDALLIGLGDPQETSPIPIKNDVGVTSYLESHGKRSTLTHASSRDSPTTSSRILHEFKYLARGTIQRPYRRKQTH
ncbi:vWA domain-containing protein [Thalassobacterium sedimentorum]|uniref:vWA domain-containing protein n=1 Tax=Thalassobacterium sedimentorum TaxID=3041258 RepID=UPI003CE57C60